MNDIAYWKLKRCAFLPSMLYPFLFLSTPAAPFTAFIWTVCVCVCVCVCACALSLTAVCFLMLCNCHVDILRGLACISHLCRSGCFVCFDYYGRPPVVISHFGGTFKMPPQQHRAPLHSRDSSVLGGGGELSVSGAVVLRVSQTPCALNVCKTTSEGPNQMSVFTRSKGTVSSAKKVHAFLRASCHRVFPDFTHRAAAAASEPYLNSFVPL